MRSHPGALPPASPLEKNASPWSYPIPTQPAPSIASYITAASPNVIFRDEDLLSQPGVVSITPASTSFLPFFSALNASMRALSSVSAAPSVYSFLHQKPGLSSNLLGRTSSIFSGARLNGSIESLSRYELIVERSKVTFEVGKITGSSIRVDIRGSVG